MIVATARKLDIDMNANKIKKEKYFALPLLPPDTFFLEGGIPAEKYFRQEEPKLPDTGDIVTVVRATDGRVTFAPMVLVD